MSKTNIKVKCNGCFTTNTFSLIDVSQDDIRKNKALCSPCEICGRELEIKDIDLINGEYQVVTSVNWKSTGEYWLPEDGFEGLTRFECEGLLDYEEYQKLDSTEQKDYNLCNSCGLVFEKYTGLCREYEYEEIKKCKDCHSDLEH